MGTVKRDDHSGVTAATSNPAGWLTVSVQQLGPSGGSFGTFDFAGWSSLRKWVELSDPGLRPHSPVATWLMATPRTSPSRAPEAPKEPPGRLLRERPLKSTECPLKSRESIA
jgi:hypothetical protein